MQAVAAVAYDVTPQVIPPAQGIPAVLGIAHLAPVGRQNGGEHGHAPAFEFVQVAQKAALEAHAVGNTHGDRHHDAGDQDCHEQLEADSDSHGRQ